MDQERKLQFLLSIAAETYAISPSLSSHYLRRMFSLLEEYNLETDPKTLLHGCSKCGSLFIFGRNIKLRTISSERKARTDLKKGEVSRLGTNLEINCLVCSYVHEIPLGVPLRLHQSKQALRAKAIAESSSTKLESRKSAHNAKVKQRQRLRASGLNGILDRKKKKDEVAKSTSSLSLQDFMSPI